MWHTGQTKQHSLSSSGRRRGGGRRKRNASFFFLHAGQIKQGLATKTSFQPGSETVLRHAVVVLCLSSPLGLLRLKKLASPPRCCWLLVLSGALSVQPTNRRRWRCATNAHPPVVLLVTTLASPSRAARPLRPGPPQQTNSFSVPSALKRALHTSPQRIQWQCVVVWPCCSSKCVIAARSVLLDAATHIQSRTHARKLHEQLHSICMRTT